MGKELLNDENDYYNQNGIESCIDCGAKLREGQQIYCESCSTLRLLSVICEKTEEEKHRELEQKRKDKRLFWWGFLCPPLWIVLLFKKTKPVVKEALPSILEIKSIADRAKSEYSGNIQKIQPKQNYIDEEKQEKKFVFADKNGNIHESGGFFIDFSGNPRNWGEAFTDSRGNLVEWGQPFYDGKDNYCAWGQPFYDSKGNYIVP